MRITAQVQLPAGAVYLVDQVFDTGLLQRLQALTLETTGWTESERFAHQPGRRVYTGTSPVLAQLTQATTSPDMTQQLSLASGLNLGYWGLDLWQDHTGYSIQPHQDYMDAPRFCHLQIYLGGPQTWNLGTAFYSGANTASALFQIPYRANSGYFMATGAEVWHGLPAIATDTCRTSVQIRYQVL